MLNIFKRKPKEIKPMCIHEWKLIDYSSYTVNAGCDVDIEEVYTYGCVKCNETKKASKWDKDKFERLLVNN